MYQIIAPLSVKVYADLIDLLIEYSDSYMFNLPNMGKFLVNERNVKFFSEYPIGFYREEDKDMHISYVKKVQKFIDLIREDIIETYTDTGYLDQVSNIEKQVYYVSVSKNTKKFFSIVESFSNWRYPNFPEDPCFLFEGKCVFQCIAHENLFFLYLDNKKIKSFLEKNRIKHIKMNPKVIPACNTGTIPCVDAETVDK